MLTTNPIILHTDGWSRVGVTKIEESGSATT